MKFIEVNHRGATQRRLINLSNVTDLYIHPSDSVSKDCIEVSYNSGKGIYLFFDNPDEALNCFERIKSEAACTNIHVGE